MASPTLRSQVYRQLESSAWPGRGLSPTNLFLAVLIIVTVGAAIAETEPMIVRGREYIFDRMEVIVGAIFAVEYVARLWVAADNPAFAKHKYPRIRYALTPIAIIDLLAVLPALFAFGGAPSLMLRFFRVLRMLRLAKLGRASRAWDQIRNALYERRYEFGLILGMLALAVLIAASLLYWAEADAQPEKFGSIPRSVWWAIITLTTIGYGDAYPVTPLGQFMASFIAITGVMLVALPTGLFAASFTEGLQRHRDRASTKPSARE